MPPNGYTCGVSCDAPTCRVADGFLDGKNMQLQERQQRYWKKNLRLIAVLAALGFVVTFVVGWFARDLQFISVFGFPFSFYMAAQGALVIYVLIVWYYARTMNRLDREFRVEGGE
jgi:putative solute:sodium symporter small subunit